MRKRRLAGGVFSAVVLVLAGGIWSVVSAQAGPTTWTVFAGQATADGAVVSNDFQPRPLTIHVGDTVVWRNQGFHTVAVGRDRNIPFDPLTGEPNLEAATPTGGPNFVFDGTGFVDSGFLEDNEAEFRVLFTASPGTYNVVCDIHQGMSMDVIVQEPGTPLPRTPQQGIQEALIHFFQADFTGRVIPMILRQSEVTLVDTPTGQVHQLAAGVGDGHVAVERFLPQSIIVPVGATVRWVNRDAESPHTVTFLPGGGLPDFTQPPPAEADVPGFPFVPVGGRAYSGQEFINSGAMFNDPRFAAASIGDSFDLTFTAPGTYQYLCVFHAEVGMFGTVTVLDVAGARVTGAGTTPAATVPLAAPAQVPSTTK